MRDNDDGPFPFGLSEDAFLRLQWILAAPFFLLAIVSFTGQLLGWWNDLGEIGTILGTIAGLIVTTSALYYNAGREQVHTVHQDLNRVHDAVTDNGAKLQTLDEIEVELNRQTGALDNQISILTQIRDRL